MSAFDGFLLAVNTSPLSLPTQDFFRFLLQNTPDQIYFKDREGRLLCISDTGAKFLNAEKPEDVIGKSDFDLLDLEFAVAAREKEQRVMDTGEPLVGLIEKVVHRDGQVSWNYTTKLPLRNAAGEICGICGINKDFGPVHEMEQAVLRERNRFEALSAELQARNTQLQRDLQLAREVQEALLPRDYPSLENGEAVEPCGLAFAHRYCPAESVSGDFFDIIPLPQKRYGVFICDVMGHGMRAALITAIIRGLMEKLRPKMSEPGRFMSELNRRLRTILKRVDEPFVSTALFLVVDIESRQIRFANAGHPAPFYMKQGQKELQTLLHDPAARPDAALGLFEKVTYATNCHPFEEGDRLFLFTDGIYEVDSPSGQELDRKGLLSCFQNHALLPTDELLSAILCDVSAYSGKKGFDDDVCIIAIERTKG